jgi:hypothetical protein
MRDVTDMTGATDATDAGRSRGLAKSDEGVATRA